jgi:hypothetical protein
MPTFGEAYIDPRFRLKAAGPGSRPAEDEWWDTEARGDLAAMLAEYLTTPQAVDAPMLLLGQPGAGKSSLTKVLAARLPAADFMVVRVALREVPAEAEIQDQVEQALRGAIGETVAWPDLARSLDGAMPVILLDGFDELLQATGIHQSDYLQRVAAFQHRESVLGRPVAVMVTSRVAVADRARLPAGTLAVRLEPFDEPQIGRWLEIWSDANAVRFASSGRRPLPASVVRRFPDLAGQPLLLLMLALYDASANALQHDDESFDTGQLYERLLSEFADREVRRLFAGQPEPAMPGLVEAELVRLSVVAFAMFHRLRLWATEQELDDDLRGLGLEPSRPVHTEAFRTPLTAGQEMVGRFFFIQRAQAIQDGRSLQTYEFLHATFGEYLVARLVVHALKDAAARQAAGTLQLRVAKADDDLLQSLVGFTALTARNTVMPFITALLAASDRTAIRAWLIGRLRIAMTRPEYVARAYRPVDKRTDHWMATYSFNLALLTLACGEPLRASEIFLHAADPAKWMRGAAQQWRAAVPSGMWLDSVDTVTVRREWNDQGRRDITLAAGNEASIEDVDPFWSHERGPDWQFRHMPGSGFSNYFELGAAMKSMLLSNNLSDDAMMHSLAPMLARLPDAVLSFRVHGPEDSESVGHSLIHLWLTSALGDDPAELVRAYARTAQTVSEPAWGSSESSKRTAASAIEVFLRSLAKDAHRLPPAEVLRLVRQVAESHRFDTSVHLASALECLVAAENPTESDLADLVVDFVHVTSNQARTWSPTFRLTVFAALGVLGDVGPALAVVDDDVETFLARTDVAAALTADPALARRVAKARDAVAGPPFRRSGPPLVRPGVEGAAWSA